MKEVRILLVHDVSSGYDDYGDPDTQLVLREGVHDWEQISDEEYAMLKTLWHKLHVSVGSNSRPVLIEKDSVPVRHRINSIKEWLAQEQAREQAEKAARQAKAQARAQKKLLAQAESERKLLEELKKKYPDA